MRGVKTCHFSRNRRASRQSIPPGKGRQWKAAFRPSLFASLALLGAAATANRVAAPSDTSRSVPDTLSQRLLACTICHGSEGRASAGGHQPRIAGKPAD